MRWTEIYRKFLQILDKLISYRYGFAICAYCLFILILLLGISEHLLSIFTVCIFAAVYALTITWCMFSVRKIGWGKTLDKAVYGSFTVFIKFFSVLISPLVFCCRIISKFILRPVNQFISRTIPGLLPNMLRPLYRFIWYVLGAGLAYYMCWRLYNLEPQAKDFVAVKFGGISYSCPIPGLEFGGLILFFGLLDLVPAYIGMFFGWLGHFTWQVKFKIYWNK